MKFCNDYIRELTSGACDARLQEVYIDTNMIPYNVKRYEEALMKFRDLFGEKEVAIYSAPGRSEVSGNHTDHQRGHALATSLNLDAIGVAAPTDDMIIHLVSGNYPLLEIDINDTTLRESELGTSSALIRGVAAGLKERGFNVGGFEAYITSDVLVGAGMSSSAAFETLVGTIISGLYNDMQVPSVDIAKIGQYAENVYFGKPCGLLDQVACSIGGLVYIDFADVDAPVIKPVPSDFEGNAYSLCIIDTKGSHANLTDDYAAIPVEMKQVAGFFGKEYLREVDKNEFFSSIGVIRESISDRAVLRAIHFFTEQDRVDEAVNALENGDFQTFLKSIKASGDSSSKSLQNIYSLKDCHAQNVSVALSASEYFLGDNGVCRVHGGGFAGTIQAFVKNDAVDDYKASIESIFGEGSCHVLKVRPYGGILVM
ncbi:MAG: galactokinase [Eubacterium sp.]|nr:galactokinase [Candidatus Colimonas fimequi]